MIHVSPGGRGDAQHPCSQGALAGSGRYPATVAISAPLTYLKQWFTLWRVSLHHAPDSAAFELALIGVAGHSVADIHCR